MDFGVFTIYLLVLKGIGAVNIGTERRGVRGNFRGGDARRVAGIHSPTPRLAPVSSGESLGG